MNRILKLISKIRNTVIILTILCIFISYCDTYIFLWNEIDIYKLIRFFTMIMIILSTVTILFSNYTWIQKLAYIFIVFPLLYIGILLATHLELPLYKRIYSPDKAQELIIQENKLLAATDFNVYTPICFCIYKYQGEISGEPWHTADESMIVKWNDNQDEVYLSIDSDNVLLNYLKVDFD